MTFIQARDYARQGVKVTHKYFTSEEYITMKGNMIIFNDGVRLNDRQWLKNRLDLLQDWSFYTL